MLAILQILRIYEPMINQRPRDQLTWDRDRDRDRLLWD